MRVFLVSVRAFVIMQMICGGDGDVGDGDDGVGGGDDGVGDDGVGIGGGGDGDGVRGMRNHCICDRVRVQLTNTRTICTLNSPLITAMMWIKASKNDETYSI